MRLRVDLDLRMLLKRSSRIQEGPTAPHCHWAKNDGSMCFLRRCSTWPVKSLTSAICSYRRSTVSDAIGPMLAQGNPPMRRDMSCRSYLGKISFPHCKCSGSCPLGTPYCRAIISFGRRWHCRSWGTPAPLSFDALSARRSFESERSAPWHR